MSAPQQSDLPARRIDSVLAITGLSLLVLSVICFFAIIIATPAGAHFDTPFWRVVGILVYVAPILGFSLLIFVVLSSFVRRSRANRGR
jgi:TRAP-type C4-dicarboxylate transport system permease small subunit